MGATVVTTLRRVTSPDDPSLNRGGAQMRSRLPRSWAQLAHPKEPRKAPPKLDPLRSSGGSPRPCEAGSPDSPKTRGKAGAPRLQTRALERLSKRCAPEAAGSGQEEGPGEDAPEAATKPPYSYVALIAMAIEASPGGRLPLRSIYQYIAGRFPYYRLGQRSWQNSVRHNLSLHECFVRMPRGGDGSPRKGSDWTLDPAFRSAFEPGKKNLRRRRAQRSQPPTSNAAAPPPPPPPPSPPVQPSCVPAGCLWVPAAVGQPPSHPIHPRPPGIVPLGGYEPGPPRPWLPGGVTPPQPLLLHPVPALPDLAFLPYWGWHEPTYSLMELK